MLVVSLGERHYGTESGSDRILDSTPNRDDRIAARVPIGVNLVFLPAEPGSGRYRHGSVWSTTYPW